jgi:hypothetical protein
MTEDRATALRRKRRSTKRRSKERHSTDMMAGGIALVVVGGLGVAAGITSLFVALLTAPTAHFGHEPSVDTRDTALTVAAAAGGGGLVLVCIGLPVFFIGAERPIIDDSAYLAPAAVSIGPTGGSFTWRF